MLKQIFLVYQNYRGNFFSVQNIALALYFVTFIILLKIRSIKLLKSWFIPLFAMYFGLLIGTLFSIFLDGTISDKYLAEYPVSTLILQAFNPLNPRGKVMFGGYLGSIFGIWFANYIFKRKSLSEFLNISAISSSLFFAIWRIGCFLDGCCYGIPNETFGISFPQRSLAFRELKKNFPDLIVENTTVPLLPTQLFSFAYGFIIFLFLLIFFCKNKIRCPYFYFFAQMLLYGIGRFIIEFFRIDPRELWGYLSMSQWIALVMIAVSLFFFIKNRKEIAESFKNEADN